MTDKSGHSRKGTLQLTLRYVWAETKRHKRSFFVGLFTVFLVTFFVSLLQTAVSKAPYIFVKLSEETAGDNDLLLTPFFGSLPEPDEIQLISLPLIDQTGVNTSLDDLDIVTGSAPRWIFLVTVYEPLTNESSNAMFMGLDSDLEEDIGVGRSFDHKPISGNDCYLSRTVVRQLKMSTEEAVGRSIKLQFILSDILNIFGMNAENMQQIVKSIIQATGFVSEELWDTSLEDVDAFNLLLGLLEEQFSIQQFDNWDDIRVALEDSVIDLQGPLSNVTIGSLLELITFNALEGINYEKNLTISAVVDNPEGKWTSALGNVIAIDSETVESWIRDIILEINDFVEEIFNVTALKNSIDALGLDVEINYDALNASQLTEAIAQAAEDFVIDEYAFISSVMYRDRIQTYLKPAKLMDLDLIDFTNAVSLELGIDYPTQFTLPVALALGLLQFVSLFLDNIFAAVVTLVAMLGVLLIYALMLGDVEARTFEYGMLRALGMKQNTLIQVLINKSTLFSIPGIAIGLVFALIANVFVSREIGAFARLPIPYGLAAGAIATAVTLAIVMPLVANIVPISRALSKTLRDSLDIYHAVVDDVKIRVIKLENLGLHPWQTILAVLLIVIGFVTFYIIPLSFVFRDFAMFLAIMLAILLGMLFGLTLLAQTLHPVIQRHVVLILTWGSHVKLLSVIIKNMSGHRSRNAKTAQMFTICLAFIIFAGAMFSLQSRSISDNIKVAIGADLQIRAMDADEPLDELSLTRFLQNEIDSGNSTVVAYTFVSFALNDLEYIDKTRVSGLSRFPSNGLNLYGVQANYFQVAYPEFLQVTEVGSNIQTRTFDGQEDPIAWLYVDADNAKLPEESQFDAAYVPPLLHVGTWNDIYPGEDGIGGGSQGTTTDDQIQQEDGITLDTITQEELTKGYTEYIDMIVSEALRESYSISLSSGLNINVRVPLDVPEESKDPFGPKLPNHLHNHYLGKARAMVSKVPGFFFSSYRQTAGFSSVLLRMDSVFKIMKDSAESRNETLSVTEPLKQTLLIKFKEGTPRSQREDVINGLRNFYDSELVTTQDTQSLVDRTAEATDILNLFFQVVGAIAMTMCFFILWISFQQNVRENAWEFGVLRAVGLSGFQAVMLYVYEAVALVTTSLLLGSGVGILIAISLTLQMDLFTELPFQFQFPTALFLTMMFMSFGVAVIGSAIPARGFLKRSVSEAIRMA